MKVSEYALSFIKDYKVTDINRKALEDIIKKLGYKLITYTTLLNNKKTEELIQSLGLESFIRQNQCFTYKNKILKIVFLRDGISDIDSIPILLHEIGHIYMDHIKKGLVDGDVRYENEANQFVSLVTRYVEKNTKRKKITSALFCTIIFTISIIALIVCIKTAYDFHQSNNQNNKTVINSSSLITNTTITTTYTTPTKTESSKSNNSDDDIFYVTNSGTKYHKEWCSVINNRTNVYYGTRKNLEDMGYEPCQLCCGDE